jgi:hypothetical protein
MDGEQMAILFSVPPCPSSGDVITEGQNLVDLNGEYQGMVIGQSLLKGWQQRGQNLDYELPSESFM